MAENDLTRRRIGLMNHLKIRLLNLYLLKISPLFYSTTMSVKKRLLSALCALIIPFCATGQQSVGYVDNFAKPNDAINSMQIVGDTLYMGGKFTSIGYGKPYGALIDSSSGLPDLNYPSPNGQVNCVVPDGVGGWFIGGEFTMVGNLTRKHLAHINSNGSVDAWNPGADTTVVTMAISGNALYFGGAFTTVGGQVRNHLAAVDTGTGVVQSWNPNANGTSIHKLIINGGVVYVSGDFTYIGGVGGAYRIKLAAINVVTGIATAWNPNPNGFVLSMYLDGNILYVGGTFSNIGGQTRNYLAAVDATTGIATSWNPNVSNPTWSYFGGGIYAVTVSGSNVYIGGFFSQVGGQSRQAVAAIDINSGVATAWNPGVGYGLDVVTDILINGNKAYVVGAFSNAASQPRSHIAAIDIATGAALPFNSDAAGNPVYCIAEYGNKLYVGGGFITIAGQKRNRLAAINISTGLLTSWNPDANNTVNCLHVMGDTVYIGGLFTNIGGQARNGLVSVNRFTGSLNSWNPNIGGSIYAFAEKGNLLYMGGGFYSMGGVSRRGIVALDVTNNTFTSFNPYANISSGSTVHSLLFRGDTLYAGGDSRLRVLSATTGTIYKTLNCADNIYALASHNNKLYIGGDYFGLGNTYFGYGLCSYDMNADTLIKLDYSVRKSSYFNRTTVHALAINGDMLYVGGDFSDIVTNYSAHPKIAAINTTTLTTNYYGDSIPLVSPWNPNCPDGGHYVSALVIKGNTVYTAGNYILSGNIPRVNLMPLIDSNNILQPSVVVSATSNPACQGGVDTFTAQLTYGGNSPTYTWYLNGNILAGVTGKSYITDTFASNDQIYCIANSSLLGNLSDTSNTITLAVNSCLAAPVITTLTPAVNLCRFGTVNIGFTAAWFLAGNVFTAQLSNAQGSFSIPTALGTFASNPGGTIIGSITATIPQSIPLGSGYRIRIVASNPSVIGNDNGADLTVSGLPSPAQATISASGSVLCAGGSITLSVPNNASNTFQWKLNGANINGATGADYEATAIGTYAAVVTNAAGCNRTSANFVLNSGSCSIAIASLSPSATLCQGGEVAVSFTAAGGYSSNNVFTAQLSNASGLFNVPKDIGTLSGANGGTITGTIPYNVVAGTNYRIRIVSSNPTGIISPNNGYGLGMNTAPAMVEAVISTSTGSNNICSGSMNTLTVPASATYTFQWARNGSIIGGANLNTYDAPQGGGYVATVTNSNGCYRSSNSKTLKLVNSPNATFTVTALANGNTKLKAIQTAAQYQWYFNGNAITNATLRNYTATVSGDYHVVVTKSTCTSVGSDITVTIGSTPREVTASGINGAGVQISMSVFPNPSTNGAQLLLQTESDAQTFSVRITDIMGKVVARLNAATDEAVSFGESFASGVYVVEVMDANGHRMAQKWVKQ